MLPRSKVVLTGLITANVCLAFWLNAGVANHHVPEPQLAELDGERIHLLAEVGPPQQQLDKPPARECRIWGPEQNPAAFDALRAKLDAVGGFPEIQEQAVRAEPDYLVYVEALGSLDNAKRVARELKALEIDSYAMNSERGAPILSVGLFSRQHLANKQQARVAELGYEVTIDVLERTQTVYNLVAHVSAENAAYESSTSACVAIAHSK